MYHEFTVKIPDVKGKIIIKKKGNASYVLFEYGRDYKPDKNTPFQNGQLLARS